MTNPRRFDKIIKDGPRGGQDRQPTASDPSILKGELTMDALELHKVNFEKFLEAIDQCKGNVYLVTDEGDRLNLKSKLCQLIGIAQILQGGMVNEAKIVCDDPEDESLLFRFNLYGDKVLEEEK